MGAVAQRCDRSNRGRAGYGGMILPNSVFNSSLSVYRVNLRSGMGMAIRQGLPNTYDYVLDAHGVPVARMDSNEFSNHWQLFVYDGDRARLLTEGVSETGRPEGAVALTADSKIAVLDRLEGQDRRILYALNPDNAARTALWEQPHYDIEDVIVDPWTRVVVGASWVEDYTRQHFFEPDLQAVNDRLAQLFPDGFANITSWSRDRKRFVVYGERAEDAGGYYVFAPDQNQLRLIGMQYPTVSGRRIGRTAGDPIPRQRWRIHPSLPHIAHWRRPAKLAAGPVGSWRTCCA